MLGSKGSSFGAFVSSAAPPAVRAAFAGGCMDLLWPNNDGIDVAHRVRVITETVNRVIDIDPLFGMVRDFGADKIGRS